MGLWFTSLANVGYLQLVPIPAKATITFGYLNHRLHHFRYWFFGPANLPALTGCLGIVPCGACPHLQPLQPGCYRSYLSGWNILKISDRSLPWGWLVSIQTLTGVGQSCLKPFPDHSRPFSGGVSLLGYTQVFTLKRAYPWHPSDVSPVHAAWVSLSPLRAKPEYQDHCLGDLIVGQFMVFHGAIQPIQFWNCRRNQ